MVGWMQTLAVVLKNTFIPVEFYTVWIQYIAENVRIAWKMKRWILFHVNAVSV